MKSEKSFYGIFAIIGVLIIFFGIKVHQSNVEFLETAQTTTAEITDIDVYYDSDGDSDYTVFVEFVVNNQKYAGALDQYDSGMYVGKEVEIYYDPTDPSDFRGSATEFVGYLVMGFGGAFILIGIIFSVNSFRRSVNAKKLKETGTLIEAKIDNVYLNRNYAINGRHPYKLRAHATLPNSEKTSTFESENIWADIQFVIETQGIKTVPVYVDLNNPKKYVIDLDEIKAYITN